MGNTEHPGKLNRGIEDFLEQQFDKVRNDKANEFITVSEILQVRHPEDFPYPFNPQHVGVLFKCDKDLDGVYSMEDLRLFSLWIQQKLQGVQTYEFRAQLQAQTMDCLLEFLYKPGGQQKLIEWFSKMLQRDNQCLKFQLKTYLRMEQLRVLYDILNIKMLNDMDIQTFFNLACRAAEESGNRIEQRLEGQENQEYIAQEICLHLISGFLRGLVKITHQVGYDRDFQ